MRPDRDQLLAEVERLRDGGASLELAMAIRTLAEAERPLGEDGDAVRRYREAVEMLRGLDLPARLAHTVRHLGDVYVDQGRPADAEPCYREALAIYGALEPDPTLDHANALRAFAVLLDRREDDEAEGCWLGALDRYEELGILQGVAECAARVALARHRAGDRPGAHTWVERGRAAAEASGDDATLAYLERVAARLDGDDAPAPT